MFSSVVNNRSFAGASPAIPWVAAPLRRVCSVTEGTAETAGGRQVVFPLKANWKKNCRKATQFLLLLLVVSLYLFKWECFFFVHGVFPFVYTYNPDPAMTTFALFNPTYGVVTWMRLFIIIIILNWKALWIRRLVWMEAQSPVFWNVGLKNWFPLNAIFPYISCKYVLCPGSPVIFIIYSPFILVSIL